MRERYSLENYGALFDAHVHTYFDYHDGMISPSQLIKATKKKGFNYVCAMAHDTVLGTKKIKKLSREQGLPSIPAMEVSTIYNHILAYGVQEWSWQRDVLQPDVAIEYLREQDCAIFLAHPYSNPHDGLWTPEIVARLDIDGIEWNNATIFYQNRKTRYIYKNFPKNRRISGSDAHHPAVYGSSFTQVDVNSEDPDDLVAAMKRGKCKAYRNTALLYEALLMLLKATIRSHVLKKHFIEGRYVIPEGDHPGSIVPDKVLSSREWVDKIMEKPLNERSFNWING